MRLSPFDPQRTGQQYTVTDFANDNTCNVQLHGQETCHFHVGQDAIMPEIALSSLPIPSEGGCGARLESFEKLPGKALYPHRETPEHDGEHIDVYVPALLRGCSVGCSPQQTSVQEVLRVIATTACGQV